MIAMIQQRLIQNTNALEKLAEEFNPQYQQSLLDRADDLERRSDLHGVAGGLSLGLAVEEGSRLFGKGDDAINRGKIKKAKEKGGLWGATKAVGREFNPKGKGFKGIGKPLSLVSMVGSAAYVPKAFKSSAQDSAAADGLRGQAVMMDPQFKQMMNNQNQTGQSTFTNGIQEKKAKVQEELLEKVASYKQFDL